MRPFLEIAYTGVVAVTLHRLRSLVTVVCLVVVLLPYLVGVAISKGIESEAEVAIDQGADLYVSASQFGSRVPIPLAGVDKINRLEGVESVTPRIVGNIVLGRERIDAVLVGLPAGEFPKTLAVVDGRLPQAGAIHELVVGTELARRLKLEVGSRIPPFYHSSSGERVSKVVGIFRSDVTLWQANLILTTFSAAGRVFDQQQAASDLLVRCRPGYADRVRKLIVRDIQLESDETTLRLEATTRDDMRSLLTGGLLHRGGIFNLHFMLLFVSAILVMLVTSGFGLSERRREIGILKATGWQTDEILLRGIAESATLGLTAALVALVLAFVWLRLLNGVWIASVFLAGVGVWPSFIIPYRLTLAPTALAVILCLVIVMSGTLFSSWCAAIAPPVTAMR